MLEFEVQLEMIGQYNRCEWMREWYRVMSAFWGRKFLALFIQKMDLDILEINWMCFCQMLGFHHGRHQAVCKFADQWLGDYCGFYLICPSRPIFKKPGNRTKVVAWWGLFSSNVKQDRYSQKWSIYLYELSLFKQNRFICGEKKIFSKLSSLTGSYSLEEGNWAEAKFYPCLLTTFDGKLSG